MKTEEDLIWEAYQKFKNKIIFEDVSGEYWIDDSGNAQYADGDVGDMNHEMIVAQNITAELLSYFDIEGDFLPINFTFLEKDHYNDIIEKLLEDHMMENDGESEMYDIFMEDEKKYINNYLRQQNIENIDAKLLVAWDDMDARIYGLQYDGWKRIHGNWIETWTLTQDDLNTIVDGIYDILDQEGVDDESNEIFNIEVRAANRTFTDIPWNDLKTRNIKKIIQYRDKIYK